MFFTLGPKIDDRFYHHHKIADLWFSHDDGWVPTAKGWYKGYGSGDFGNWCSLIADKTSVVLDHDLYRGFPLWWDGNSLTNLLGTGQSIWADERVTVMPTGISLEKKDVIGEIGDSFSTIDAVVDAIAHRLGENLAWLSENLQTYPKKIFPTGGTDTALLYAVVKHFGIDVEIIDYEYFKYDWFTNHNITNIRKRHWAYRQIHHWTSDCILITGGCGDEFLFRGPGQIATWAAWHDIDLEDLLMRSDGYHKDYFLSDKNLSLIRDAFDNRQQIKLDFPTRRDLLRRLLDINVNDHQHWHLGKTLTYTPFKDLELTKLVLSLPPEQLLGQILDARINQLLIEKFYPAARDYVSESKNYNHRRTLNNQKFR